MVILKRKIEVLKALITDDKLLLETESVQEDTSKWIAKGHILVDSDQFSFLYILDDGDDFIYINIPENVWPDVNQAKKQRLPVYAVVNNRDILLDHFYQELDFLLENIKGNANYGEELEKKVENAFD